MKFSPQLLVLLAFCFGVYANTQAQTKALTKTEKKEILAKLKGFKKNPDSYKSMTNNYDRSIKDRDEKMELLEKELADLKAKNAMEIRTCSDSVSAIRARMDQQAKENVFSAKLPMGTVYGVQIGNYKLFDVAKYFGTDKFLIAFAENDAHQYVISNFPDAMAAESCGKDFRKLGIKDAFVTKYVDGKRVPFDFKKDKE